MQERERFLYDKDKKDKVEEAKNELRASRTITLQQVSKPTANYENTQFNLYSHSGIAGAMMVNNRLDSYGGRKASNSIMNIYGLPSDKDQQSLEGPDTPILKGKPASHYNSIIAEQLS